MPKDSISRTAQVNLQMLAQLGVPEAVRFSDALQLEGDPMRVLSAIPYARRIPVCVSCISEVLYQSANQLILEANNPTILDLACGYSPRVLLMAPMGYTYIGADLPDITHDLNTHRAQLLPADVDCFAGYRTVNATHREQMDSAVGALREPLTVVTQGLLSYLYLNEKAQLVESIRELLSRDGGCWVIPDADPGTLLMDTFRCVLGNIATGIVERVYSVLDHQVGRDRSRIGWQTSEGIICALQQKGFVVQRVPLYREGMELRCLQKVSTHAADRLKDCWSQKSSLVATLAPQPTV